MKIKKLMASFELCLIIILWSCFGKAQILYWQPSYRIEGNILWGRPGKVLR